MTADAASIVALVAPSAAARAQFADPPAALAAVRAGAELALSSYKRPREFLWAPHGIERNAMGKVNKKQLAAQCDVLRAQSALFLQWR